ncbi:MAG: hypothetical protein WCP55_04835 [Lentisphaerota bacterium]
MTPSAPLKKKIQLNKRTAAFAKFLIRRNEYEDRAKEITEELERSNREMARLAEKLQWCGKIP